MREEGSPEPAALTGAEQAAGGDDAAIRAQADREALDALVYGWGEAYLLWHDGDGWHARRRDRLGGVITADSADGLDAAMLNDYRMKPVPRDLPADA